jgi:hypothetical protein
MIAPETDEDEKEEFPGETKIPKVEYDSMPTTASLPAAVAKRSRQIIENPEAPEQVELLAEAIQLAEPPAFFFVWQDGPDSIGRFVRALDQAGLRSFHLVRSPNIEDYLKSLEERPSGALAPDWIIFLGCLSQLTDDKRKHFNVARDRLLRLPTKMIFVESIADEREVRLDFPDVVSQVSYDCRLFLRAGEPDLFATGDPPAQQQADANGEKLTTLSGTVHEVRETEALCWLEIAPGNRLLFSVPFAHIAHLNPQPGLELLWSPGKSGELPTFWKREPEEPDPQLLAEFEELTGRFHKDLKHRKQRLPKDNSRPS